jgi:GntR family transcriptional regulator, transcriptional repressor for pyruvate dehydrogenase complex
MFSEKSHPQRKTNHMTETNNAPLRKKKKVKVSQQIIQLLRQDIVTGRLPQGERMPSEKQLADTYGVSQPTLREALRGLETLGLVKVLHGSGAYVSGKGESTLASALLTFMQLEDIGVLEVQSVRSILGTESAALAAATATADQVKAIEIAIVAMDRLSEARRIEDVYERLIGYQKAIAAASNNPLLETLELFLATLMLKLQMGLFSSRSLPYWRDRCMRLQPDRKLIWRAVHDRSADRARQAAAVYFGKISEAFESDAQLKRARLSDPTIVESLTHMSQVLDLRSP